MKILHCPTPTGGNAYGLAQGERAIGLDSTVMYYNNTWLGYPCDINLQIAKYNFLKKCHKGLSFFIKSLSTYDVFHFNFGRTLLTCPGLGLFGVDLPIYKWAGKKVIVTYNGCDIRLQGNCGACQDLNAGGREGSACDTNMCDRKKLANIRKFHKYADHIFAVNPDLLQFLPNGEFIPYTIQDFDKLCPNKKKHTNKIKIAHAPTNQQVKGTFYIQKAMKQICSENQDVEFQLIQNVSNVHARLLLQQVDIVIDQLLIGWYGGLAVEAMALGVPVICFIREEDLKFIPMEMKEEIPIINANPTNIHKVIMETIEDRKNLLQIGEMSRAYVEKWHDPIKIAGRMKEVYRA
ncbi:MAG: glycosyltransferase [Candidatus Neomarinimicrobiota bacterium]